MVNGVSHHGRYTFYRGQTHAGVVIRVRSARALYHTCFRAPIRVVIRIAGTLQHAFPRTVIRIVSPVWTINSALVGQRICIGILGAELNASAVD